MGPAETKMKQGHSYQGENCKDPDYEHDLRLVTRLKRRSVANKMLYYNYCANVTRTTVKNCGIAPEVTSEDDADRVEDKVDCEYKDHLDNMFIIRMTCMMMTLLVLILKVTKATPMKMTMIRILSILSCIIRM